MNPTMFNIHEFGTGRVVASSRSFDRAMNQCIRLHIASMRLLSYYVRQVAA